MSQSSSSGAAVAVPAVTKTAITVSVMLATMMVALDTTIANVALPRMAGSISASAEQITWVLTSYIVASAVMTPVTGWLSGKVGRKRLLIVAITGFTLASMLCGLAMGLGSMVLFRMLQGLFGASLIPLSQSVLLDINPPEDHGRAMAIWGMGTLLGPIMGPALGGWLTDNFSWRWVFFINLPIGLLALAGVVMFMRHRTREDQKPFDFLGFAFLALAIASLQLCMDRGPTQDWFDSLEIWIELLTGVTALYLFIIHTLTSEHPFFDRRMWADRNFIGSTVFSCVMMVFLFSTMALLPPLLEVQMGYPVVTTGLVTMPRGVASFLSMWVAGRLARRLNVHAMIAIGVGCNAVGLWQMSHFFLGMDSRPILLSGFIQGFGMGFLYVPLTTLAFATLPSSLRGEGSGLYNLARSMGSSAGISVLQAVLIANMARAHAVLASHVTDVNPVLHRGYSMLDPHTTTGLAALNALVTRQAAMIAYTIDFRLLFFTSLSVLPLLLLLKAPKQKIRTDELPIPE